MSPLFTSSRDRKVKLEKIPDALGRFLNFKVAEKVDQELSIPFKRLELYNTRFAQGATPTSYNRVFICYDSHTSRNASVFMVFEKVLLDNESSAHHLLYHLAKQQGKAKTLDEMK